MAARNLFVAAVALAPASASSQSYYEERPAWALPVVPEAVGEPSQFVPKGWIAVSIQRGDLNKDRRDDAVVLMRMADPSRIVGTGGAADPKDNQNPYLIVVGFRDGPAVYRRVAVNRDLLESFHGPLGADAASNDGTVIIRRGALVIEQEYIRSHETYRFRWDGHDFALIGFDCGGVAGGTYSGLSANYVTHRARIERGEVGEDKTSSWTVRIRLGKRPTLDQRDWEYGWIGQDADGEELSC